MVKAARKLQPGKSYIHYYPWQNKGETQSRMKLAAVTYVPEWDWVIGPSAYQGDFLDGLIWIRNLILIISIIAIILVLLISYLFSANISKALMKGTRMAQKVAEGDLTAYVDLDSRDELAN